MRRFARAGRRIIYGTWPRCVVMFGFRALVLLPTHELIFLDAFVRLVWSCWRLAPFCCMLCFMRLTAAASLRLLFVAGSLLFGSPSAAVSRCAVAWSWRCACRCTSSFFAAPWRGAAAALAVALRASSLRWVWSCRCACCGCFGLLRCAVAGKFCAPADGSRCAVPCRLSFDLPVSDGWCRRLLKGMTPSCWLALSTGILKAVAV